MAQSKLESIYKKGIEINVYSDSTRTKAIFQLKPTFRFQSRFETSGDAAGNEKWESNFLIRRARLKFDGFILTPNLVYKVELALSPSDLKATSDFQETGRASKVLLDAVVKWRFQKNLTLWVGQTKLPGNRSRVISSQNGQLVDRSELNNIFNLDRDLGAQLHGKFNAGQVVFNPIFAFSKGEGRNILSNNIGGFSYTGKLELLPFGEFINKGDYFEADLEREEKPKLSLAAAANFNQGASRQTQTSVFLIDTAGEYMSNDLLTIFADALFKYKGFSFLGEYAYKKILLKPGQSLSFSDSTIISASGKSYHTGQGVSFQAGYLFKYNIELAARYTTVIPDWEKGFTGSTEYTLGLSKYIIGHKLKVQTDVTLIDAVNTTDYQMRYRLQMEFAF
ncbi:MAG: OprO/OprP family phosphate-selective porin [Flavobacteriales bacterium]|nr:OprO/OprP family phosphate-selective porin [Flavobacteriales bacterium]